MQKVKGVYMCCEVTLELQIIEEGMMATHC